MNLVYDLAVQPHSLGDLLMHLETSLILRGTSPVDVTIIGNPSEGLMQVAHVNQFLGTVRRVPPGTEVHGWPRGGGYTHYECCRLLTKYFNKHGAIPSLEPRAAILDRAEDIVGADVTVSLRNSSTHPRRNSDMKAWRRFMKNHPETQFLVLCKPSELDDSIAALTNVDTLVDDAQMACSLIYASRLHMGVASGPMQMRWYQDKPFVAFKESIAVERVSGMTYEDGSKKMPWHNEYQRLLTEDDTTDNIEREFARLDEVSRHRKGRQAGVSPGKPLEGLAA